MASNRQVGTIDHHSGETLAAMTDGRTRTTYQAMASAPTESNVVWNISTRTTPSKPPITT